MLSTSELAVADKKDLHIGQVPASGEGDDVLLSLDRSGNPLPFKYHFHSIDLVPKQGCLLKLQFPGGSFHLAPQFLEYQLLATFKEED